MYCRTGRVRLGLLSNCSGGSSLMKPMSEQWAGTTEYQITTPGRCKVITLLQTGKDGYVSTCSPSSASQRRTCYKASPNPSEFQSH
jgi:hypothetical protein